MSQRGDMVHKRAVYNDSGLILGLRPANERRRYKVTPSFTGWAQSKKICPMMLFAMSNAVNNVPYSEKITKDIRQRVLWSAKRDNSLTDIVVWTLLCDRKNKLRGVIDYPYLFY